MEKQSNHPNDLVRVKNPTNKDFTFTWDSIPKRIDAGEEQTMVRWLAVHYAKKIIVAIINSKITKVKVGERTVDSIRTNDPAIQAKLVPHILLYVVQRFVAAPKVEKKVTAASEFTVSEFEISEKERHVDTKIDLPALGESEASDIFGIPKELEQGFGETPKEAKQPAEETSTPPEPIKEVTTDETIKEKEDILPDVSTGKKARKKATLSELTQEARALGIDYKASDDYATLESKILKESGAG